MSKKVLGTNCRIATLPEGTTAKIDGTGRVIITLSECFNLICNDTITGTTKIGIHSLGGALEIYPFNGITDPYDEKSRMTLVGVDNTFDDSGFHDWEGNTN